MEGAASRNALPGTLCRRRRCHEGKDTPHHVWQEREQGIPQSERDGDRAVGREVAWFGMPEYVNFGIEMHLIY